MKNTVNNERKGVARLFESLSGLSAELVSKPQSGQQSRTRSNKCAETQYKSFDYRDCIQKWGTENYLSWTNEISRQERNAFHVYTRGVYVCINDYLRNNVVDDRYGKDYIVSLSSNISSGLAKAFVPENIVTYRGVSPKYLRSVFGISEDIMDDKIYEILQEKISSDKGIDFKRIMEKGFMSTTLGVTTADWFSLQERSRKIAFVFKINVPVGEKGAYIEHLSTKHREYEMLFQKGRVLRVRGVVSKELLMYKRVEIECDMI